MTDTPDARIAYHHSPGTGPTIVFLPGYASDMQGTKALAIEAWAKEAGRGFVRFDYRGCGASDGAFEDFTLADWRDDALMIVDRLVEGPVVLVGSSMGGWIMLLVARMRPDRVVGMVGIAPAPDFTDWGFTTNDKMTLLTDGRLEKPSRYGPEPIVTTRAFWTSGEANRLLFGPIAIGCPVRIVQGSADPEVPWERAQRLAQQLGSADVQTWIVKDGDHRLSRPQDIVTILRAIMEVIPPA